MMRLAENAAKCPVHLGKLSRVEEMRLAPGVAEEFAAATLAVSLAEVEFSPLIRFQLTEKLMHLAGDDFRQSLISTLQDYERGAVLLDYRDAYENMNVDSIIKLLTAVTYAFGTCNHDHVSGTYYYKFTLTGEKIFKTPLNNPFKDMHIHTDGCFSHGFSDFVLMAKFEESGTEGGESKVLHIQDLDELESILQSPLAWRKYLFKGHAAHNLTQGYYRQLFWKADNTIRLNLNNATVSPRDLEEARFLSELHQKIDDASHLTTLASGQCLILNNTFWTHGRGKFTKISEQSVRTLLRMRGSFQSRSFHSESEVFAKAVG
jgi:glutarate dioxygenase